MSLLLRASILGNKLFESHSDPLHLPVDQAFRLSNTSVTVANVPFDVSLTSENLQSFGDGECGPLAGNIALLTGFLNERTSGTTRPQSRRCDRHSMSIFAAPSKLISSGWIFLPFGEILYSSAAAYCLGARDRFTCMKCADHQKIERRPILSFPCDGLITRHAPFES